MTDLLQGRIDILGYEINPDTTINKFEKDIGDKFYKEINPKNENLIIFCLNNKIGFTFYNLEIERPVFNLYGMEFINVQVVFFQGKINAVNLITNLHSYITDENGKRIYSDAKIKERFEILNRWAITNFGEPTFTNQSAIYWDKDWGRIKPNSIIFSGPSTVFITYKQSV